MDGGGGPTRSTVIGLEPLAAPWGEADLASHVEEMPAG